MAIPHTTRCLCFAVAISIGLIHLSDGASDDQGKVTKLQRFGVSFRPPADWFVPDRDKIADNIRKLDSEKENISAILASHRGSIALATFLKHDPRGRAEMIPTINVLGRPNPHGTFDQFRTMIAASATSLGAALRNYVLKSAPADRSLGGRRVVMFAAEYDIGTAGGDTHRVASTTCAIPCGDIFLQVSMSESLPAKHSEVFQGFIESFTFEKP